MNPHRTRLRFPRLDTSPAAARYENVSFDEVRVIAEIVEESAHELCLRTETGVKIPQEVLVAAVGGGELSRREETAESRETSRPQPEPTDVKPREAFPTAYFPSSRLSAEGLAVDPETLGRCRDPVVRPRHGITGRQTV